MSTPASPMTSRATASIRAFQEIEFLAKADERHHDFRDDRRASRFRHLDGSLEDGARLHLIDFGIGDPQTAATMTEHRVEFVQLIDALQLFDETPMTPATSSISSSVCGRNSCSGGSSRRMVPDDLP
jgi:hypothetical protein